jgi:hypothetical protein
MTTELPDLPAWVMERAERICPHRDIHVLFARYWRRRSRASPHWEQGFLGAVREEAQAIDRFKHRRRRFLRGRPPLPATEKAR